MALSCLTALNLLTKLRANAGCGCSNIEREGHRHSCPSANSNGHFNTVNHHAVNNAVVDPTETAQPLTEANLTTHNVCMCTAAHGHTSIQHWLAHPNDNLIQGGTAVNWTQLVQGDALAADIEAVV